LAPTSGLSRGTFVGRDSGLLTDGVRVTPISGFFGGRWVG